MLKKNKVILLILLTVLIVVTIFYYENKSTTISKLTKVDLTKNNHYGLTMYITGTEDGLYRKDMKDEYLPLVTEYLKSLHIKEFSLDRQKTKIMENSDIVKQKHTPYNIFFYQKDKFGRLIITTFGSNRISISCNDKDFGIYEITNGEIDYEILDNIFEKLQIYENQ